MLSPPVANLQPSAAPVLQRKCDCGEPASKGGETCEACETEEPLRLQPKLKIGAGEARSSPDFSRVPAHRPWAGPPRPLAHFPHEGEIGRRLGPPPPGAALLDPEGCARRGAPAFTEAGRAHFQTPEPPLAVAAHEAAHVLQQRDLTRDLGLGAEIHAAAIERRLTAGRDARTLITTRGAAPGRGPHPYTIVPIEEQAAMREWEAGLDLRVSDDGWMAVEDDPDGSRKFWTSPAKAIESNKVLKATNSSVQLVALGGELTGSAPEDGEERTLNPVAVANLKDATIGDPTCIGPDCGQVAQSIMGAKSGKEVGAVFRKARRGAPLLQTSPGANEPELMEREIETAVTGQDDPEFADSVFRLLSTDPEKREILDEMVGINEYAQPRTGEAFAISTTSAYNFHYGAVVMTSGSDRVTLENFVGHMPSDWGFRMYGPSSKAGQTFHEQNKGFDEEGVDPMTMRVRKRPKKK